MHAFLMILCLVSTLGLRYFISKTEAEVDNANDWCSLSQKHTMCTTRPDGCPQNIRVIRKQLNAHQIKVILSEHNRIRKSINDGTFDGMPLPAQPLPMLEWDDGVAEVAQRWAEQCSFHHDEVRFTDKYNVVGQNIYWVGSTGNINDTRNWIKGINSWALQERNFVKAKGNVASYGDSESKAKNFVNKTGSFTQIIWQKTVAIGCGEYYIKEINHFLPEQVFIVCNYAPAGNYLGFPIYIPRGTIWM